VKLETSKMCQIISNAELALGNIMAPVFFIPEESR